MYGRYGTDTLNLVLLIAGLVIAFIAQLTRFWPLTLIAYAFYIYAIFRMLSRNTAQRQKEYYSFLNVGLSNILYSERFKEGSKFFFGREPGQGAHR